MSGPCETWPFWLLLGRCGDRNLGEPGEQTSGADASGKYVSIIGMARMRVGFTNIAGETAYSDLVFKIFEQGTTS